MDVPQDTKVITFKLVSTLEGTIQNQTKQSLNCHRTKSYQSSAMCTLQAFVVVLEPAQNLHFEEEMTRKCKTFFVPNTAASLPTSTLDSLVPL